MMLEVRLLGSFRITRGATVVTIRSRTAQSLFAFLILNAGVAFRREKLAGQLWPDSMEESARDYLRHALWRLRKALQDASAGSWLQADDLTISFNDSSDYWLDVTALRGAKEAGPVDELAQALSGYTGELLPGFYEEWVVLEREHVRGVYERKLGSLLDLLNQAGRWQEILEWAEKWIAFGQKPESAYRHLMSAYAAQGDMVNAATTFDRCVKSLAEFGIEPSEQTRRLYEELKARKEARPAQRKKIRVFIADDHALFREGLRALLNAMPDIEVVGDASDGEAAIAQLKNIQTDVVLMDINMPRVNGLEAMRFIRQAHPNVGVIMLTMLEDDASVFAAMKAGARGYMLKGAHHEEVLQAIRTVAGGQAVFGPAVAARMITFFQHLSAVSKPTAPTDTFPELTSREREVLRLMSQGAGNQDIAEKLVISGKTVSNHITSIFSKLQVADRAQAVLRARDAGMGE